MARSPTELSVKIAGKARQYSSPAALHAAAAEQVWKLRTPRTPQRSRVRVPGVLPSVYWPTQYEWPLAEGWVRPLRDGMGGFTSVEPRAIDQPYKGIVLFEVDYRNEAPKTIAVDYYDYTFINEQCLAQVALYFKMQHLRSGYGERNVVPGGYVTGNRSLYRHYRRLRSLPRDGGKVDVYGRFGTKFSADIRRRAVELLRGQTRFEFTGGTSLVPYPRTLREAAQARVCIDLPGNGPFCFRLVDYLAVGACIVAPRHATIMHAELVDRKHIIYCRDDLEDLVDLCAHYVEDDQAREATGANAATFFDEHLQPQQLAGYYLRTLDERLRFEGADSTDR